MASLIKEGKVVRPWVGIGLQNLTEELAQSFNLQEKEGALIGQVYEGSPAEKAGLKVGDVVIDIDGVPIKGSQDVVREVLRKQLGQKIQITVVREGKRVEIPVVTEQMPAEPSAEKTGQAEKKDWFGLGIKPITPEMAKQLGLSRAEGVIIDTVDPGSAAQEVGLRKGDVVLEVNRQRIQNELEYQKAMEKTKPEQGVLLLVIRRGSTFFVTLKEEK
jgi:serine protease Do